MAAGWLDELAPEDRRLFEESVAERFHRLRLAIRDDAGTAYQAHSASAGGTGTELRGEWLFRPGAPGRATELTIEPLQVSSGSAVTVSIGR